MNISPTAPVITPTIPIGTPGMPNPFQTIGTVKIGLGRDEAVYQTRELRTNRFARPIGSAITGDLLEAAKQAQAILRGPQPLHDARFAIALIREGRSNIVSFVRVEADELLMRGIDKQPGIQSFEFLNGINGLGGLVTSQGMQFAPRSLPPLPMPPVPNPVPNPTPVPTPPAPTPLRSTQS